MNGLLPSGFGLASSAIGAAVAGVPWLAVAAIAAAIPYIAVGVLLALGSVRSRHDESMRARPARTSRA
jgi:hypothetical protein